MSDDKELAWYSAAIEAWLNTRFEFDKSILTLSSAAIGLLVTFVPDGAKTIEFVVVYVLALVCFLVSIFGVLAILKRNADALHAMITKNQQRDVLLGALDWIVAITFVFGVVLTSFLGFSMTANKLRENSAMIHDSKNTGAPHQDKQISVDKFGDMKPPTPSPASPPQPPAPQPAKP